MLVTHRYDGATCPVENREAFDPALDVWPMTLTIDAEDGIDE